MAKQALTLKSNIKDYQKFLRYRHGALPKIASQTVNTGAKVVKSAYDKELNKFTLRNRFTKGAVQIMFSRPKSRGGDFRNIGDINSIVGIKKLRGKDHYLKDQETGKIKRGSSQTKGSVPIPIDKNARTSGAHNRPVKTALRLQKVGAIQNLKMGSQTLGVNDRFNARGGAQRWAILYKYTGLSGSGRGNRSRGQQHAVGRYGWDLTKQFFFQGMKRGLGIFQGVGKRVRMIRNLDEKAVKIKATHKLEKSTDKLTPTMFTAIFKREAQKYMGKK